jgi:hypothetical protein
LGSGPGALTVLQDGSTVLIPGIDAWYVTRKHPILPKIPQDVCIQDALLQQNLGVDFFVIPPAEGLSRAEDTSHLDTTLFPKWCVCYTCKSLIRINEPNRIKCPRCLKQGKKGKKMVQTNFVVACEDGHLDEFPWLEWVHRGADQICVSPELTFKANGVVQLSSQIVVCNSCNKRRDLSGTSTSNEDGTTELSRNLDPTKVFTCSGGQPWLLSSNPNCSKPIRMVLRSSNNIYFSNTVSSILVPTDSGLHSEALERIEASNKEGVYLGLLLKNDYDYESVAQVIKEFDFVIYEGINVSELAAALSEKFPSGADIKTNNLEEVNLFDRSPEWTALMSPREDAQLVVRNVDEFDSKHYGIEKLHSVPLLKKTTALKGFTRLKPREIAPAFGRQLLRRNPFGKHSNWLPAIRQTGEGIFVSLDRKKILEWSANSAVQTRLAIITSNLKKNSVELSGAKVSPTFVLLHTLSHVLIQELVIECGYTSASLAERIYSQEGQNGLLIYTASASADGTMGGLVEMAHPPYFLNALDRAVERARWCSNDPVCMELGNLGQGNSGSNLAACHNCCLLPETTCEHFNQGLDRAMLIGDSTGNTNLLGYFDC